ncbi:hypothetical protein TNCV_4541081 [Trichonephila clavipes]|nr:hypothetical protein TNCV_4541081 [Trichonephila clavipes]
MFHVLILPPDPYTVRVRQDEFMASWSSQIRRLPSVQNKVQRDSSDHITRFHSSNVQCLLSRRFCKITFVFWAEISGFFTGTRLCFSMLCNSLRML